MTKYRALYIADTKDKYFNKEKEHAVQWGLYQCYDLPTVDPNEKLSKLDVLVLDEDGLKIKDLSLRDYDLIVFDYGALCRTAAMGAPGLIDYWNRWFIKQIKDHPSIRWACTSCLDTFEPEDRKELEDLGVKFQW